MLDERTPGPLRVVFVCAQNKLRSPTAEAVFRADATLEVTSAGTNRDAETVLTRDLLAWADVAVCMEKRHRDLIRARFRGVLPDDRLVTLGIPDKYDFMDADLVDLLARLVPPRLEKFRRLRGAS
ncbi:low molecular weight protein tyrosine phosphatase family protein [Deinococcus maricopensis]|uniref:Protein-tyrosine phosphatase, low molecular weight n=1 Tax=Deinococcus maricopensis (strain DSM 21211 / LMG 22137 / NRRL B-23946 / LB-34) TaxID=709986 RepID=E8U7W8_DEIML|nr:protein-tyrosine-phosphatase [Deinococcus maricopensis]ADV67157.1 Protein-tyrosine phosphatase, low molecular weight [Deinococcus maricopensis DSM 21211]